MQQPFLAIDGGEQAVKLLQHFTAGNHDRIDAAIAPASALKGTFVIFSAALITFAERDRRTALRQRIRQQFAATVAA